MKFFKGIFTIIFFLFATMQAVADIPPGWEFTVSPSSHIFSIPESAWPVINSNPIEPGDYIGVFYDDNGVQKCGGAIEWPAEGGTVLFAYGDDAITGEKDGFDYEEPIQWRLYSQTMQVEVLAAVQLDPSYPTPGDLFIPEGMSGVLNIAGGGFYVFAFADEDNLCQGYYTQLHAEPGGGMGNYSFDWTSDPSGFTSTEQNPFVQVNDTTTYTVTVSDGTNTCYDHTIINAIPHPEVDAGVDDTICAAQNFSCTASSTSTQSITWVTMGDGSFNFPHSPTAIYTPGTDDIDNGEVSLVIAGSAWEPCDIVARDTVNVTILPPPSAYAGDDQATCEEIEVLLSGTAENYNSIMWITNGNGTFSNPEALNTTYYTEDVYEETTVTLTLQAYGNTPCGNAYDAIELTIYPGPQSDAGNDAIICSDETFTTDGNATNFTTVEWSSFGDGTFVNATSYTAEYTPGANDLSDGAVYLTFTAFPTAPCSQPDSDSILLTFQPLPEVFAGYDQTVCELDAVSLSGYSDHTATVLWSTSGDGTFANASALATSYSPGSQDLQNETVTLSLTGEALAPCSSQTEDLMEVIFIKAPLSNAGDDATTCSGETFITSGSIQYTTNSVWSSNGTGTFEDPTQLTTTYTPSQDDYNAGEVILTLTASANSACGPHSDNMTLSFADIPSVDAGEDQVIAFGTSTQLQGEVNGGSGNYTHTWQPEEMLLSQGILNPATVNLESSILFTLSSIDNTSGCSSNDAVTVFVTGGALSVEVTATPDEICPGEEVQLQAIPSGGSGDYTFSWSSDPAGFSSNSPEPNVTPSENTIYFVEVSDGFNQTEGSVVVTVHEIPIADAGTNQSIYHGTTTTISGSASGGSGNYDWQWSPAAMLINPDQQETVTTKLYDETTFQLVVTDTETGCSSSDQTTVSMATAALSASPEANPSQACHGETVHLYANADGGAEEYSFNWYSEPPGFVSNEENPQFTAQQQIRIWLEVDDGWNTTSAYLDLGVFPMNQVYIEAFPNDTICAQESVTLTAISQLEALNWLWSPGGATTPEITVDTTGLGNGTHIFSLQCTDLNGCLSTAEKIIFFDICQQITEDYYEPISIHPNPTNRDFTIEIPTELIAGRLEIINAQGEVVYYKKAIRESEITITQIALPGIYFVRIFSDGVLQTGEKVIIY